MSGEYVGLPVVSVARVVGHTRRRKHPYRAGFFMQQSYVGIEELLNRLIDKSLGVQSIKVLLAMVADCDYENRVHAGAKDIARRTEMAESHVSTAIKALVDCGFVERRANSRGRYTISPTLCWKGGEESLRAALSERGMLDADGYLKAA